ncbi:MAG TPA: PIN domain-containing protein [Acidobacteriota bacterium]|nr:PIN domain-containing protein [Acidobacteriota bacterium]
MNAQIIYVDTSVFGGVFDVEFGRASRLFFEQVQKGNLRIRVSSLVVAEILRAPSDVREFFERHRKRMDLIYLEKPSIELAEAYLRAGIVGKSSFYDALHVALATVSGSSLIASWNFRHIVHFDKIALYNAVNRICGYHEIGICSPLEVIRYE